MPVAGAERTRISTTVPSFPSPSLRQRSWSHRSPHAVRSTTTRTVLPEEINAVIFDMDGVITDTASVHAEAWKRLFDEYLRERAARTREPFVPFDADGDYRRYVDGKSRFDGVRSFLASRSIKLPEGDPNDPPDRE